MKCPPTTTNQMPGVLPDPVGLATHPDPYPAYARWRDGPPLVFDRRCRLWIASRADVVGALLMHPGLRVRPAAEPVPHILAGGSAGEVFAQLVRMNDGVRHEQAKPALQRLLSGALLQRLPASARHAAQRLPPMPLDAWVFALPLLALAHALGVDDAACAAAASDGRAFAACIPASATAAQVQAGHAAAERLSDRLRTLIAHAPAPSPLALLRAEPPGDAQTWVANLVGLFSQTCDGTAGLLGSAVRACARDPALAARLRATPEPLPDFIAEVARHDPPIQNTRRFVATACSVYGVDLAAGDGVLLLLAAANRDPALNCEPDVFRLNRADRRTLGFGHGAHACPGQAAAFAMAAVGLRTLLDADTDFGALACTRSRAGFHASANARIPFFGTGASR